MASLALNDARFLGDVRDFNTLWDLAALIAAWEPKKAGGLYGDNVAKGQGDRFLSKQTALHLAPDVTPNHSGCSWRQIATVETTSCVRNSSILEYRIANA